MERANRSLKLEVGKHYFNGFAARVKIIKAPDSYNRWYEDEYENRYHEDGAYVGTDRVAEFNLQEMEP